MEGFQTLSGLCGLFLVGLLAGEGGVGVEGSVEGGDGG